jgi:hypothetical protein
MREKMKNEDWENLLIDFKKTIEEVENDNFDSVETLKDSVISFLEKSKDKKEFLKDIKELNIHLQNSIEKKVSFYSKELEDAQKRASNIAKYQSNNILQEI